MQESYCFNYNEYRDNLSGSLRTIRELEYFNDVTLACEDGEVNAHKILLYTGSKFFQKILPKFKSPNPFIYLKGLKLKNLNSILDFVYYGEVSLNVKDLNEVLNVARDLKIKGFAEMFENEQMMDVDGDISKVSKELDDLLHTISEKGKEEERDTSRLTETDTEEEQVSPLVAQNEDLDIDVDTKALELMRKHLTEEGKVSWHCTKCDFQSNDKARTRRHVKGNHLRKDNPDSSAQVKTEFDEDDVKALELMERDQTAEGRVSWRCLKCEFASHDKHRTRRHVKSNHLKKSLIGLNDETFHKWQGKVELEGADLEALELMERELSEEGKVSWRCQTCQFSCSDKTRTRKHVRTNHIKRNEADESDHNLTLDVSLGKVELDEEDMAALQLMVRLKCEEEAGWVWQCTVCERRHADKTRIRKHVKSTHV